MKFTQSKTARYAYFTVLALALLFSLIGAHAAAPLHWWQRIVWVPIPAPPFLLPTIPIW